MDGNGTFFSTIIALVTGAIIVGAIINLFVLIAGVILVLWMLFTVAYYINELRERKADDSNASPL